MTGIQIFNNPEFGKIRTVTEDNKILFCGKDVAVALGYSNPSKAVRDHCKGGPKRYPLQTSGGEQEARFITEPDLYRLIINSKLPNAQKFESWVFDEVLPQIRSTGGYIPTQGIETSEELLARALKIADETLKRQQIQIDEMKPKALFADAVSTANTSILVGDLAKLLKQNGVNMGSKRLFEYLRTHGYLIKRKGSDYNSPTQYAMELGLFEIKETVITHSDGHTTINKTPKVTGKGQQYFINKMINTICVN